MHRCFRDGETHQPSGMGGPGDGREWARALRAFVGLTRWFVVYVGEDGGGMFNHVDRHQTSAWQAQVPSSSSSSSTYPWHAMLIKMPKIHAHFK